MSLSTASFYYSIAGWSSPVARQAHNLKVASSNLAPAPNEGRFVNETAFAIFETLSAAPSALKKERKVMNQAARISFGSLQKPTLTKELMRIFPRNQP